MLREICEICVKLNHLCELFLVRLPWLVNCKLRIESYLAGFYSMWLELIRHRTGLFRGFSLSRIFLQGREYAL